MSPITTVYQADQRDRREPVRAGHRSDAARDHKRELGVESLNIAERLLISTRSKRTTQAAAGLAFLGVGIAAAANEHDRDDREITAADSGVRTLVLEAREDLEIARQVHGLLLQSSRR